MYISFEGILGICWAALDFFGVDGDVSDCFIVEVGRGVLLLLGRGGGKGDMDILVTEAECAWYTRSVENVGSWMTCWRAVSFDCSVQNVKILTILPL